ncbi:MAG: signal peptidase II [Bacilli bacterium]|nr:signal peptidase II [Bacilli bacterium]
MKIIILILLFIVIDFVSKILVINLLKSNTLIIINNFLKFTYIKNMGAAFGILSGNIILLIIITLFFIYYIIKELKNNSDKKLSIISYALILSGAIGNLIDRVFRGYVVDFISFTIFGREMAVFNVADSYITIGVILLLISMFKENLWKK